MRKLLFALLVALPAVALADSRCPNLLIVLDASDSMGQPPSADAGSTTKIQIARTVISQVLLGDLDAGVAPADSRIRFGYAYFPVTTSCAPGTEEVACNFGTVPTIVSEVNAQTLKNGTPTAETLGMLTDGGDLTDSSRPRYVLVLTDGMPTCGNDAGGRSIAAVQTLFDQGVETFVVGFGSEAARAQITLSGMAAAGQGQFPDGGVAQYYQANDATSLASALSTILAQAGGELGGGSCDPCLDANCSSNQRCELDGGLPTCVADPCHSANCGTGEFCRPLDDAGFACIDACTMGCPAGQACQDGNCVTDGCDHGTCANCSNGEVAELDGGCGPNLCLGITCPANAPLCLYGSCFASYVSDAGSTGGSNGSGGSGSSGTTSGMKSATASGCGCNAVDGVALFGLGALVLALRRRR